MVSGNPESVEKWAEIMQQEHAQRIVEKQQRIEHMKKNAQQREQELRKKILFKKQS